MFELKNTIIAASTCLIILHITHLIYQYGPTKTDNDKLVTKSAISFPILVTIITFIIQFSLLYIGVSIKREKSE
jgi:hypothetical protein